MTWRCNWNNCNHEEEFLINICEHVLDKHKDFPKETAFDVTEFGQRTLI